MSNDKSILYGQSAYEATVKGYLGEQPDSATVEPSDGQINEMTMEALGLWPSFEAQSWACRVVRVVLATLAKPQRITEQDARDIIGSFLATNTAYLNWRNDYLPELLAKLNEYRVTETPLDVTREPDYKANEWRPIETAPKDGTIIDMYGFHPTYELDENYEQLQGFLRRITDCKWDSENQRWIKRWFNDVEDELWTTEYQDMTHWMPRPTKPAIAKAGASTDSGVKS